MYDIRSLLSIPTTDEALRSSLQDWQSEVYEALTAAGKMDDPAVRFGGTIPLHLLDPRERIRLMGKYRQLIGLDDVLNNLSRMGPGNISEHLTERWGLDDTTNARINNIWENLTAEKSVSSESPYGRFQGDIEDNSLIGRIYRSINLQLYDRPNRAEKTGISTPGKSVRQFFGLGSIPTLDALDTPKIPDLRNKNILVFDLETAGFRPGSIREVAYKAFNAGADGIIDFGALTREGAEGVENGSIVMRPIQGTRGSVMHEGRAMPVDEFIRVNYGMDAPVSSSGDDFIAKVMPFLRKASEMDMVVGHNIEGFDFGNIFESLSNTGRYKSDPNFAKEIDELHGAIRAKSVDTLRLARQAPNLQGLKALHEGMTAYSIQNLLLNTDLSQRIGLKHITAAMGMEETSTGEFIFRKGLHFGDVDALLTTGILQHLPDLKQVSMIDSAMSAGDKRIAQAIEAHAMQSASITPFTDARDPKLIHQRVLDRVGINAKINPIEHEVILTRNMQMHDSQRVLQTAVQGVDPQRLAESFGGFDRLIGRAHGQSYAEVYDRLVKPNSTAYAAYQDQLAKLGYGFSGLSYEERLYGTAMSDITLRNNPGMRGNIARETLTSQFQLFDPLAIEYATTSGKLTLPAQVLREAGLLDKTDDPASYLISIVRPTIKKETPSINLAYRFTSTEDKNRVASVIGEMLRDENRFYEIMGLEGDTARSAAYEKFVKQNEQFNLTDLLHKDNTTKYGVTVGQILDQDAVDEIIALEGAANNAVDLKDTNRLQFALYHADLNIEAGGKGTITTAGVALQRGLNDADRVSIARSVEATRARYDPTTGMKGVGSSARAAVAARFYDRGAVQTERMAKMFNFFDQTVMPNVPKLALGGIIAGAGAYLWNRKRRNDQYDMDFESEGQEIGPSRYAVADVLQARIDAGYDGGRVQIDPLATANLTHHLYYSSIGHTNLEWDRNNAIYGGVL